MTPIGAADLSDSGEMARCLAANFGRALPPNPGSWVTRFGLPGATPDHSGQQSDKQQHSRRWLRDLTLYMKPGLGLLFPDCTKNGE